MPLNLEKLPAQGAEGAWNVVVESPRGSQVKLHYDAGLRVFSLSRPLPHGLHYPHDWGFIPSTVGQDGDPLDALVLWEPSSFPGTLIPCRLVGVIELEQSKKNGRRERNDRLLAVPVASERDVLESALDLPARTRAELAHFFVSVVALEGKEPRVLGVRGPREAEALARASAGKRRRAA